MKGNSRRQASNLFEVHYNTVKNWMRIYQAESLEKKTNAYAEENEEQRQTFIKAIEPLTEKPHVYLR